MVDVVDRATRSRMMSGIRGRDTKPEVTVRKFLHRSGLRFRLHANLPGKPDLVFPKYRTAVLVHGCFWHRHEGCRYTTTPVNNAAFWKEKFASNVRNDAKVLRRLRELGWRVLVTWSCQLSERELGRLATTIKRSPSMRNTNGKGR
jgi:DNA mismatch endonuclease (patch repair protein)